MTHSIAICDDSPEDRAHILSLAERWARLRGERISPAQFSSAESFLFSLGDCSWDILLLDVEMGGMDGVSMAKELRKTDQAIQIIFITGYQEYIAQGYDVSALHYLMKPVEEEKLFAVLDRAARANEKNERALTLELRDEVIRIPLYKIQYVDVQLNYVTVHTGPQEAYTLKRPLKEIAAQLDERFYRAGRSLVVNLRCVARVTKTEIYLDGGSRLPLPRGAYAGINQAIIRLE